MMRIFPAIRRALLPGSAAFVVACGGQAVTPVGSSTSAVDVRLHEWAIGATPASVPSGRVTFQATNEGPDWAHELVVIKTDLPLDAVPTKAGGSVDESAAGLAVIGETATVEPGAAASVTLDLAPGNYLFVCNVIEDIRFHYALGMRSPFVVTP